MRSKLLWSMLITVVVICAAFWGADKVFPEKDKRGTSFDRNLENSEPAKEKHEEKPKYFLTLKGESLCAYAEKNGTKRLIHSKPAHTILMSDDDIKKLREGIYAENYEDLCLFLEAYIS